MEGALLVVQSLVEVLHEKYNCKNIKKVKDSACPDATQDLELNTKNRNAANQGRAHSIWPFKLIG